MCAAKDVTTPKLQIFQLLLEIALFTITAEILARSLANFHCQ